MYQRRIEVCRTTANDYIQDILFHARSPVRLKNLRPDAPKLTPGLKALRYTKRLTCLRLQSAGDLRGYGKLRLTGSCLASKSIN